MPRRDGTGPEGRGSQTGRGLGPCGNNDGEFTNDRGRLGLGRRGFGRGRGNGMGRGRIRRKK